MIEYIRDHEIKKFFETNNNIITCRLCPHNCKIFEGKSGLCKTRINKRGQFYSIVYGQPSAMHIDPIEKKPLYHFYPGSKIFSPGTMGCNLFCKGCQNYDISISAIKELPKQSPEEIVQIALNNNVHSIAYTYNEPTIFYEYMTDIARIAKKNHIKNVIVSNGYINKEPLNKLLRFIDAANIDLKGFNEKFYKNYSNAHLEPVLSALKTIKKYECWLEVTNLIIPKLNDEEKEIDEMCKWIKTNLKNTPIHFSRFFPYYKAQEKSMTPKESLLAAKEIAKKYIDYVYIGNIGILENTYCHNCGALLIQRYPDIFVKGLINSRCSECRKKIPGIFK